VAVFLFAAAVVDRCGSLQCRHKKTCRHSCRRWAV